jgi:uncharacterized damage-inducible protein DinB
MEQVKWFDRKFDFDFKENIFPLIQSRLKETPEQLFRIVKPIPIQFLSVRVDDKWSIKENIGHLTDLEPLWQRRLEDIISGAEEMHPADLSNSKTDQANHNRRTADDLLNEFAAVRNQTLAMIENTGEEIIFKSSLHPRLKTPMRTMDLFLFVAEHDDHHLNRISSIEEQLRKVH